MIQKKLYENLPLYPLVLRILKNVRHQTHPKWGIKLNCNPKKIITHFVLHGHPLAASAICQMANLSHQKSVVWTVIHRLDVVGKKKEVNHIDPHPHSPTSSLLLKVVSLVNNTNTSYSSIGNKILPQVLASMESYSRKQ